MKKKVIYTGWASKRFMNRKQPQVWGKSDGFFAPEIYRTMTDNKEYKDEEMKVKITIRKI